MDVWTLGEKFKSNTKRLDELDNRISHVEEYLKGLNSKLELINKASNEKVQG